MHPPLNPDTVLFRTVVDTIHIATATASKSAVASILEYITTFKELIVVIVAIVTGYWGYFKWKSEQKDRTDILRKEKEENKRDKHFEEIRIVAKQALKSIYNLRDTVAFFRSPFIPAGEMEEAILKLREDKNYNNILEEDKSKAAMIIRWRDVVKYYNEFLTSKKEAEILLGTEAVKVLAPIDACIRKMNGALTIFLSFSKDTRHDLDRFLHILSAGLPPEEGKPDFNIELENAFKQADVFWGRYVRFTS